jgi:hypothetical protein
VFVQSRQTPALEVEFNKDSPGHSRQPDSVRERSLTWIPLAGDLLRSGNHNRETTSDDDAMVAAIAEQPEAIEAVVADPDDASTEGSSAWISPAPRWSPTWRTVALAAEKAVWMEQRARSASPRYGPILADEIAAQEIVGRRSTSRGGPLPRPRLALETLADGPSPAGSRFSLGDEPRGRGSKADGSGLELIIFGQGRTRDAGR